MKAIPTAIWLFVKVRKSDILDCESKNENEKNIIIWCLEMFKFTKELAKS